MDGIGTRLLGNADENVGEVVLGLADDVFEAESTHLLPQESRSKVVVQLGRSVQSVITATGYLKHVLPAIRQYAFRIENPDAAWRRCVNALRLGQTHTDLALAAA